MVKEDTIEFENDVTIKQCKNSQFFSRRRVRNPSYLGRNLAQTNYKGNYS